MDSCNSTVLLAPAVAEKQQLEELGLLLGKADVAHAEGLVGRVDSALQLAGEKAEVVLVRGGYGRLLQLLHRGEVGEDGLGGAWQGGGDRPRVDPLNSAGPYKLEGSPENILSCDPDLGWHIRLLTITIDI